MTKLPQPANLLPKKRKPNRSKMAALGVLLSGMALGIPLASAAEFRLWKDNTGKHSIRAELVRTSEQAVILKTDQGKEVTVPLNRLSQADRAYLQELPATPANPPAETGSGAPRYGDANVLLARMGLQVEAQDGSYQNLACSFPLPLEWPEQKIEILQKTASDNVNPRTIRMQTLEDGVQQVRFLVPRLLQGETAEVVFQVKITRQAIRPPENPSRLRFAAKTSSKHRKYLGESPLIETRHPTLRKEAEKLSLDASTSAWEQVRMIRDHTHRVIRYTGVKALKGAVKGLASGGGDCEERTSLFVALCRLKKIPARSIWIPGHAYAEFYLEDENGQGHWFPCESVGQEFGEKGASFIILQKGDRFRDPLKAGLQRYISESAKGSVIRGGGAPLLHPIREIHAE